MTGRLVSLGTVDAPPFGSVLDGRGALGRALDIERQMMAADRDN